MRDEAATDQRLKFDTDGGELGGLTIHSEIPDGGHDV